MSNLIETYQDYTGHESGYPYEPDWHAVYTITLGELIDDDVFNWEHSDVNWSEAAYSDEQYERVCNYFIERFRWREISIIPYKEWAARLRYKIVYELMPKYKVLYERVDSGINPLQESDEYMKSRSISSAYPETLLSENADYISDGKDDEYEKIVEGDMVKHVIDFANAWKGVDELLVNDLESMFICLYTTHINAE